MSKKPRRNLNKKYTRFIDCPRKIQYISFLIQEQCAFFN